MHRSRRLRPVLILLVAAFSTVCVARTKNGEFRPGAPWVDSDGKHINAHGGAILLVKDTYYWFGEKRDRQKSDGVSVYSSRDLYNWKKEGMALSVDERNAASDIARGCVMERPKVLFNEKTGKYVMWIHLELEGQGYSAARAAVAVSDRVTGPYRFITSFRPNGNMSRDMTVYQDDDGRAFLIYSSRRNLDMRVVQLTDDYLSVTTHDEMIFSEHREAPAMFKSKGLYYLITSNCTGWKPNEASLHVSKSIFGPWKNLGDPMRGKKSDTTFDGQSAFVLPVPGQQDQFIFVADRWNPANIGNSEYIWLPVQFDKGDPVIKWMDTWNLSFFGTNDPGSAKDTQNKNK